jgi:hypothetical protein
MLLSCDTKAATMHVYSVATQQCFLSECEKQERGARENQPPEPAEFFLKLVLRSQFRLLSL